MTGRAIGQLQAVLTGLALPYTRKGSLSAIQKLPQEGPVAAGPSGLAGDEQGDLRVHGGADKAVHCYAWSHYAYWREVLPPQTHALLAQPGAFGENFSMEGLAEDQVCLGDVWQVGSAKFEVSQGRQPCWKLNDRFAVPDMARQVQDGGRAGWYLRTAQPGVVRAGDTVWLLARPYPDWSVARLLQLITDRNCDPKLLIEVLSLPLTPSWQRLFSRRLENEQPEDWGPRMQGESTS
jgi:MOSC domain-containing protein YiiM